MLHDEMKERLLQARKVLPIVVPSYNRWDKRRSLTLSRTLAECSDEIRSNVYVFVRPEQERAYRKAYEGYGYHIVTLPPMEGVKLVKTRQFILDWAKENRMPYVLEIDDDITHLYWLYLDPKSGYTHHSKQSEKMNSEVLMLLAELSIECFKDDPKVCLTAVRKRRFCQGPENSSTKYWINGGQTPRAVTVFNVKRMDEMGIRYNPMFETTGDDIGICAEILKAGGKLASIPSLAMWFTDDKVDSVVRNDDNRKSLAQYEYSCLMKYPIRDYLKISHTYEDGSYAFGDISWRMYHNKYGTKGRRVEW